jgi:hypothetical protein
VCWYKKHSKRRERERERERIRKKELGRKKGKRKKEREGKREEGGKGKIKTLCHVSTKFASWKKFKVPSNVLHHKNELQK